MSDRSEGRRRRIVLGSALVLVLASLLGLYSQRQVLAPRLATWVLHDRMDLSALGPLDFRIASVGVRHLSLRDLSLEDAGLVLDELEVTYAPGDLLTGRLQALRLRGLTLRAERTGGGMRFGRLDALAQRFGAGEVAQQQHGTKTVPVLPFERLDLQDARLLYRGPQEDGEIPFALTLQADPAGGFAVSGSAAPRLARQPGTRIEATLSAAAEVGPTGALSARGTLGSLALTMPDFRLEIEGGTFAVDRPADTAPSARARLPFVTMRAGALDLAGAALELEYRDRTVGMSFALTGRERPGDVSLSVDLRERDDQRLAVDLAAAGDLATLHRLIRSVLILPPDDVSGRVAMALSGSLPGSIDTLPVLFSGNDSAASINTAELSGEVTLTAALARKERPQASVSAVLQVGLRNGVSTVHILKDSRARLTDEAFGLLLPPLPAGLRPLFATGLTAVPRDTGVPNRITLEKRPQGWLARSDLALRLDSEPAVRAELDARATLHLGGAEPGPAWELLLERMQLRSSDLAVEGMRFEGVGLDIGGWLGPDGLEGQVLMQGAARIARPELRGRSELTARMRVRRLADGSLHLDVDRLEAAARRIAVPAAGVAVPLLRLATAANRTIEVRYAPSGGGAEQLTVDGALALRKTTLSVPIAGEERRIAIEPGRLDVALAAGGEHRMTLALGRSRIESDLVRLSGLTSSLAIRLDGAGPRLTDLKLDIARIEDGETPARIAPLSLSLAGGAGGPDGGLALDGVVSAPSAALRLPFALSMRRDLGAGRLSIPETDIVLGPGDTEPLALVPLLAGRVSQVRGRVRLAAEMPWPVDAGAGESAVMLQLADVAVTAGDVLVEGVEADISLSGFAEPRTLRPAAFSARQVRLGVVLRDLEGALDPSGPNDLRLQGLTAAFAGGRVAIGPARYRPGATVSTLLRADGLDGAALTALSKVEGLTMTGRLFGRLPVSWSPDGGFAVVEGRLGAETPGIVRYRPDDGGAKLRAAGGEQVALMLDALSNFHYTVLEVTVDGRPADGFKIGIALKGANPDLYDGHPLEFNLNLTGQLDDIIKTGYQTYALPERLGETLLRGLVDR